MELHTNAVHVCVCVYEDVVWVCVCVCEDVDVVGGSVYYVHSTIYVHVHVVQ